MSDTNLLGVIQLAVQETVKGMKMPDMATGTVVTAEPLTVQPDLMLPPIPAAALVLTSAVKAKTAPVQGGQGGTVVVSEGLIPGDKVLMLKVSGGNRYLVLSKL